jgi:HEAT repeat protein
LRSQKLQTGVRGLIFLVICSGAIAWAWRNATAPTDVEKKTGDWVSMIMSGSVDERKFALGNLKPSNPSEWDLAIATATRALEDPEVSVRIEAAAALTRFATATSESRPTVDVDRSRSIGRTLLEAYRRDQDSSVRALAAGSVSSIYTAMVKAGARPGDGADGDPLSPEALVAAFDGGLKGDATNRVPLVTAIERLGPVPMVAPPGLLSALDDPSHFVRGQVLQAVSHFSSGVDPAVPVLLHDLVTNTDRYPPDYPSIAGALHPSPAVVPALTAALKGDNALVRQTAATILSQVEPAPRAEAPLVVALVKKELASGDGPAGGDDLPDPVSAAAPKGVAPGSGNRIEQPTPGTVGLGLAVSLARMAPPEQAVPLLVELLKRKAPASRSAAAAGLAEIGPAAYTAVPTLLATMKEALGKDGRAASGFGSRTARALGRIASQAPQTQANAAEILAVLAEALKSRSPAVRAAAVEALGQFGPKAASALPTIRELSEDRSQPVRDAAQAAIPKIEPHAAPANDAKS